MISAKPFQLAKQESGKAEEKISATDCTDFHGLKFLICVIRAIRG